MVKGVCWDPIGKYLASQSDDRSLRVWRTEDWIMETQLQEPFQQCSGTTHLLRLSWSPDGRNIATAHALNNTYPVAYIVDRNNWKSDHSLVGHQKAIEVAAFNHNLFSYDSKATRGHTIVALGSKDGSISIWSTAKTKPILVVDNIFTSSILDLSWSPDGYCLLACSWDSSVASLSFTRSELGYVLNLSHLLKLHMDIYGCTGLPSTDSLLNNSFIETPMMLVLQQSNNAQTLDKSENGNSNSEPVLQPTQISTVSIQIENRTKEGKRRITPKFISPPSHLAPKPIPTKAVESNTLNYSSSVPLITSGIPSLHTSALSASIQMSQLLPGTSGSAESDVLNSATAKITSTVTNPSPNLSIGSLSAQMNHGVFATLAGPPIISSVTASCGSKREHMQDLTTTNKMSSISHETPHYSIHVDNTRLFGALLRVCLKPSRQWDVILLSQVVSYSCSEYYIIMACSDSSVHVFSVSGRRLLSPIQLSSPVIKAIVSAKFLVVITMEIEIHMWDIVGMRSVITSQPVSPLIANKKLKVINLSIHDMGPLMTLSDDTSYIFNLNLISWQCINLNYSLHSQPDFISHPYSSIRSIGASSIARSQSFIEAQLNSAITLNSKQDYLRWLHRYVEFLTDHELSIQLKELLTDLVKPILDESDSQDLSPSQKLTSDNPTFINSLIAIVGKNVHLQRIYTEFSELLHL